MANKVFTSNYKCTHPYLPQFKIGSAENSEYVERLAKWMMSRIKSAAKAYHEKNNGVKDNGATGKKVTITHKQLVQKIIDTNGTTEDGTKLYFGPTVLMTNPGRAVKLGLMTSDENSRKPSADRIRSKKDNGTKGDYSNENMQIITKSQNLAKGADDVAPNTNHNVKVTVGVVELLIENCSAKYLAAYTQSLAA